MWKRYVPGAAVLLLVLIVYFNAFPGTFILDDRSIVAENQLVERLDLRAIFSADYWGPGGNTGLYRPLTILSFALNRQAFGASAASFHAVNLLLHAAVCLLVLSLGRSLRFDPLISWFAAAGFAVHPIHAEPVNELVGRSELLAAFFVLAALVLARSDGQTLRCGVLPCYAAALLCKEQGIVFPALLFLTDAFADGGILPAARKRRRLYLALALLTVAWFLLRYWVQSLGTGPRSPDDPVENPLVGLPLLPRVLTALEIQVLYLAKLLLPLGLRAVYAAGSVTIVRSVLSPWGLTVVAIFGLLPAALLYGWARRSPAAFGSLWYAISAAVTANLLFTHAVIMAERFAYLPSAGFSFVIPALILQPATNGVPTSHRRTAVGGAILVFYLGILGGTTILRNVEYQNPVRLWERATGVDPGNAVAYTFLGDARDTAGDVKGAESAYRTALRLSPDYEKAYALADLLLREGRVDEALAVCIQGTRINPDIPTAWMGIARVSVLRGRPEEALEALGKTGPGYRSFGVYWHTRGWARELQGDLGGAVADYREALRISVPPPDLLLRLGAVLLRLGRAGEAEDTARAAVASGGGGPAFNQLGVSLALQQRFSEAAAAFRQAIALQPAAEKYRENLRMALDKSLVQWR